MTEFTWNIVDLISTADTGVVTQCAWICRCDNGEFEGSCTLPEIDPSSPNFIFYQNLTEELVLQWLFSLLGDEKAVVEGAANLEPTEPITAEPSVVTGKPWE